jgi:hypothetical protein
VARKRSLGRDSWYIMHVVPEKPEMTAALSGDGDSQARCIERGGEDEAQAGSSEKDVEDDKQKVPEYKGPSGLVVKHRKASAKVYGIRFFKGVPKTGKVRRMRNRYKRDWVLVEPPGPPLSKEQLEKFKPASVTAAA